MGRGLQRRWQLILGMALLGLVAGAFYASLEPPQHTGRAALMVDGDFQAFQQAVQELDPAPFLPGIAERHRMAESPEFGAGASRAEMLRRMAARISIEPQPGTRSIQIGFTARWPQVAQAAAGNLATAYAEALAGRDMGRISRFVAGPPDGPFIPGWRETLLRFTLAGLALGALLALWRERTWR